MQNRDIELRVPWAISDKKKKKRRSWPLKATDYMSNQIKKSFFVSRAYLEYKTIFLAPAKLASMFPRYAKDCLVRIVHPSQSGKIITIWKKKVKIKNSCVQWHLNNDWTFDYTFVHTLLKKLTFQSFSRAMVAIFSGFSRQPFKLVKISLCFNCLWPISIGKWFVWVKKGKGW